MDLKNSVKPISIYGSILLAFVLWFIMFVVKPFNFFLMMSLSTLLLSLISFGLDWPVLSKDELTWRNFFLGIVAAAALYTIFFIGNRTLIWISERTHLLPGRLESLNSIYAKQASLSSELVGFLLFFPIGFGEEIYWRGFIQKYFTVRWGAQKAFWVTTFLYSLVHVPTLNPVLILAAFTCGLFWGGMFALTRNLLPVMISHMLWDPLIFIILPLQ